MNILPMQYFLVVAEQKSITKAAQQLHITQQTLSVHMASLEKELNCRLFERKPFFTLTYAGEVFQRYCKQFVSLNHSMVQEFQDISTEESGSLSLGIAYTRGRYLVSRMIPSYRKAYPKMQLSMHEDANEALIRKLLADELDLIIGSVPSDNPDLTVKHFYNEELSLVIPKKLIPYGILSAVKTTRDLSLLADYPFLLNDSIDVVGRFSQHLLEKANIVPKTAATSESLQSLMELCSAEVGIGFCPTIFTGMFFTGQDHLAIVPLQESYPISFAWKNRSYTKKAINNFVDTCLSMQQQKSSI